MNMINIQLSLFFSASDNINELCKMNDEARTRGVPTQEEKMITLLGMGSIQLQRLQFSATHNKQLKTGIQLPNVVQAVDDS